MDTFCILLDEKPYWFDLKHRLQGLEEDIAEIFDAMEDSKDRLQRFNGEDREAFRYTGTDKVNLDDL